MPRKISAREVAEDIRSGMHENQLMVKYEISLSQLRKMRKKLEDKGFLPSEASDQSRRIDAQRAGPAHCLGCGYTTDQPFDECPRCGLIASKAYGSATTPVMSMPATAYQNAVRLEGPISYRRQVKLITGLVLLALLLIVIIGSSMIHRRNLSAVLNLARPTVELLAVSDPLETDWQKATETLGDIKQRNQGMLSGWTKDMDYLLELTTSMIAASVKGRRIQENFKREEAERENPTTQGHSGSDLANPVEDRYQEVHRRDTATIDRLANIPHGGKMPIGPTEQERFLMLSGQVRITCKKILEAK